MAKRKLVVEIIGDGQSLKKALGGASKDVDKFGKKTGRLKSVLAGVGKAGLVGGAALGGGLAVGLKKSVDAFAEAERVGKQTEAVIKSTGKSANVTERHVGKLAERLSLLSGMDDEAIQSGQNLLLTFTQIRNEAGKGNKIFDRTTQAAVDMSAAFEASGKTMSVSDAAVQLGKALNDPAKGMSRLTRVGVTFTDGQQKQVKALVESGRTLDAQKIILRELNKEFGGSAKAAGQTTAGAFNRLEVAVGNAMESIGGMFAPTLAKGANALAKFVAEIQKGAGAGGRFRDRVVSAFNDVKRALTTARQAVSTAVSAIRTFLKRHEADFQAVARTAQKVAKAIADVFKRALPGIKTALSGIAGIVKGVVNVVLGIIRGDWARAWKGLKAAVTGALKMVLGSVRTMTAPLREGIARLARAGWSAFKSGMAKLPGLALAALKGLPKAILSIREKAREAILGVVRSIQSVARKLVGWFVELGKDVVRGLVRGIKAAPGAVGNAVKGIAEGALDTAKGVLDIGSPSRKFHEIGVQVVQGFARGLSASKSIAAAGLATGLLFPVEAAIADLQRQRAALEESFAEWDKRRERAGLLKGVSDARRGVSRALSAPMGGGGTGGGSRPSGGRTGGGQWGGFSNIVELGKALQRAGFKVSEHPAFGGVGKHAPRSHHYSANALDVNADGAPGGEAKALDKLYRKLKGMPGVVELLWKVKGHFDHLHVAFKPAAKQARAAVANFVKGQRKTGGKSGKLSPNEVRGYLYAAGFRGKALDTAVAVAFAESGGDTKARNKNSDGSIDRGLMQINSVHGGLSTFDPAANARAAFKISKGGKDFSPWVAFQKGAHKKFLGNVGRGKGRGGSGGSATGGGAGDWAANVKDAKAGLSEAKKALAEFNKEQARARKLAQIDLKISGLEKVQQFKAIIEDVRTSLKDAATEAAAAWRKMAESGIEKALKDTLAAIKDSPAARELERLTAEGTAESQAREDAANQRNLEDAERALAEFRDSKELAKARARLERAKASGNAAFIKKAQKDYDALVRQEEDLVRGVEDAKYQIRETARGRRVDQLGLEVSAAEAKATEEADVARAGLDQQEADLAASLGNQLLMLAGNLEARKTTYRQFVKDVKAILGPYGVDFAGSPDQEAGVTGSLLTGAEQLALTGPLKVTGKGVYRKTASGKWLKIQNADGSPVKRAAGGPIRPGTVYRWNEMGHETLTMGPDGRMAVRSSRSSGTGGDGAPIIGHMTVHNHGDRFAEERFANKVAWRVATGR